MKSVVKTLEAAVEASHEDERPSRRFVRRDPIKENELVAVEERLGLLLPPSLREFVKEYGPFSLGEEESRYYLVYLYSTQEWNTGVGYYADQLCCDPTVEGVANAIGMAPEECTGLAEVVIVGSGEDEDYLAFDLRTRSATGECEFYRMRFEDDEIAYLTKEETKTVEGRGLDAWLLEVAADWPD